jgi:hypothetical protein
MYPCTFSDYGRLIDHPRERSESYLKEATSGSILLPLLGSWVAGIGDAKSVSKLAELQSGPLQHCTLQAWIPDEDSDDAIYAGGRDHGLSLTGLRIVGDGSSLLKELAADCELHPAANSMSVVQAKMWPLLLVACRHYRLPVPVHFWIDALRPKPAAA